MIICPSAHIDKVDQVATLPTQILSAAPGFRLFFFVLFQNEVFEEGERERVRERERETEREREREREKERDSHTMNVCEREIVTQ